MEKEYAHALIEAAKRGAKPHELATRLGAMLRDRGHLSLLPKIARALKEEDKRVRRGSEFVLSVAKESEVSSAKAEATVHIGDTPTRVVTDDSLIGGWVLSTPNTRVDASFKKQLLNLYHSLTA